MTRILVPKVIIVLSKSTDSQWPNTIQSNNLIAAKTRVVTLQEVKEKRKDSETSTRSRVNLYARNLIILQKISRQSLAG